MQVKARKGIVNIILYYCHGTYCPVGAPPHPHTHTHTHTPSRDRIVNGGQIHSQFPVEPNQ